MLQARATLQGETEDSAPNNRILFRSGDFIDLSAPT